MTENKIEIICPHCGHDEHFIIAGGCGQRSRMVYKCKKCKETFYS
jgi:transposase-like protein